MPAEQKQYLYPLPPASWMDRTRRNLRVFRKLDPLFQFLGRVGKKLNEWAGFSSSLKVNSTHYAPLANKLPESNQTLGYVGTEEIEAFINYRDGVLKNEYEGTESGDLYDRVIKEVSTFLKAHKEIKRVLNFGVCYAHVDAELAKQFPDVEFHGVDRSPFTKLLNENEFGELPNLKFHCGDGFSVLQNGNFDMLIHIRTAVVLSKPLVDRLYGTARSSGVQYVVGYEQFGFSYQTMEPYVFSTQDKDSVWWRGFMFVHNYPGLLMKNGYDISKYDFLTTRHPAPDYRIFEWYARLV